MATITCRCAPQFFFGCMLSNFIPGDCVSLCLEIYHERVTSTLQVFRLVSVAPEPSPYGKLECKIRRVCETTSRSSSIKDHTSVRQ